MFKIKNNKGFSMVELLAVIVILGVISTIGIVSIIKMVDNSKKNYYINQEKQIVLAAQSYVNDNRHLLPKTVGSITVITLKELREKNYIKEEIVDQNKNKCYEEKHTKKDKNGNEIELEGSRVEVYKASKTDYKYVGYLECDACEGKGDTPTTCYASETKKEPSIKISFPNVTNDKPLNENDVVSIEIKGTEGNENIKVASYSYKIYVNNVLNKSSGLKINNIQHLITINNNKLFNLIPGTIKVVVSATNTEGISKTTQLSKDLSKLLPPACGKVTYENANAMKNYDYKNPDEISCGTTDYPWLNINSSNKTRQAWVLCNEHYKLGCAQHEFSSYFTTEGENQEVIIKDKHGNNQTCTIKKCMDYSNPTCSLTVTGTKSSHSGYYYGDKSLTVKFDSKTDSISGINSYDLTTTSTASYNKNSSISSTSTQQGEKTYYGYVKDKATNVNSCNKKITVTLKHTISFNGNGGTPSFNSIDQYWKDPIGNLPTASRTGHKFAGWYTEASGGTQITSSTEMPASNVTYYAHWTPNVCTIYYNANGGDFNTTTPTTQYVNYGENIGNSSNGMRDAKGGTYNALKEWYTIDSSTAWNTKANGKGTNYNEGSNYAATTVCGSALNTGDASATLYVKWRLTRITFSYHTISNTKLVCNKYTVCAKSAGCAKYCGGSKTDGCFFTPEGKNSENAHTADYEDACTGSTTGVIYKKTCNNDGKGWAIHGLRNYVTIKDVDDPDSPKIKIVSSNNKCGDGKWRVGSATSSVEINQQTPFEDGRKLAEACGEDYFTKLKHDDITIDFYAGGFSNDCI